MTKQGINKKSVTSIKKQRITKNNDSCLVMDWILNRVGGIDLREKEEEKEKEGEEEKKTIVVKKVVIRKVVTNNKFCKKLRRHSF